MGMQSFHSCDDCLWHFKASQAHDIRVVVGVLHIP